ncbi:MAG TPA: hypothetical protein VGN12_16085 [Pirellulales bacterium]|jgi:hypothetical protein
MGDKPLAVDEGNLSDALRMAVKTLRERPIQQDSLTRSLASAQELALRETLAEPAEHETIRKSKNAFVLNRRRSRSLIRVAVLSAATILVAAIVPTAWRATEPQTSWAQVVEAVKSRPWVRCVEDRQDPGRFEAWSNQDRQKLCFRRERWLHFANLQTRLYEIYDVDQNLIRRAPVDSEGLLLEVVGGLQMFFQLTDGIPKEGSFVNSQELALSRREVKAVVDGHEWIDFIFTTSRFSFTVRVDAKTHLPASLIQPESAPWLFEYPTKGPNDVYEFGAPADAGVLDCRPPMEVAKIRLQLRAAANRLGDYVGYIVHLTAGEATEVARVWRAGRRFRCERALATPPASHIADLALPMSIANEATWIANLDRNLTFVPTEVFDGETVWQRADSDKAPQQVWNVVRHTGSDRDGDCDLFRPFIWEMPHNYLFPEVSYLCEVDRAEFTKRPDDGPAGSVRIRSHMTDVFTGSGSYEPCYSEMWLDPARGHACLRYFRTENDRRPPKRESKVCCEMDGFRQHSSGVWYPTIVRRCDDDGKVLAGEQAEELRMYWDFDRPVPAEAFTRSIEPVRDR